MVQQNQNRLHQQFLELDLLEEYFLLHQDEEFLNRHHQIHQIHQGLHHQRVHHQQTLLC
jgi:hypothetical protein